MKDYRVLLVMGVLLVIGGLVYLLAPILTPFLLAFLIAYALNPLIERMTKWRIPRTLAIVIVFALGISVLLTAVLILIPVIQRQVLIFAAKIPGYIDLAYDAMIPWLQSISSNLALQLDMDTIKQQVLQHWQQVGERLGTFIGYIAQSGMHLAGWVVNLILIPVVIFYLLRDWDNVLRHTRSLFPPKLQQQLGALVHETDQVLASFLRGQLVVMIALAVVYATGLWLVGIDLALPIGLLAGVVSFVPYLGFIVGILVAGVAALLQFQDAAVLIWVTVVFIVGQGLEGMVLTPRLVGERIGLHPVAVIFAIMAGGQLFGFLGILLALPAAAALLVWARHVRKAYRRSDVKSKRKGIVKARPSPS